MRVIFEIPLLFLGRCLIPLLTRKAVIGLSRVAGSLTYKLSHKQRRVAEANVDVAFGDTKSCDEKRDIIVKSFQSFALLLLDLFWFNAFTVRRLNRFARYDDSAKILLAPAPHILLTAHYGNWEIIGLNSGHVGRAMTSIAMPLKNSFIDRELHRLRTKTGSAIAEREGGITQIVRALRNGQNTTLLVDQNTIPEAGGVFVPFFGLPAPVTRAAGALWARTKAEIVIAWCTPDENGVYTIYARPLFPEGAPSLKSDQITARSVQAIESIIREHPEYWMWSYKRWRIWREADDKSRFPFYARPYERYARYYNRRFLHKQSSTKDS